MLEKKNLNGMACELNEDDMENVSGGLILDGYSFDTTWQESHPNGPDLEDTTYYGVKIDPTSYGVKIDPTPKITIPTF